MEKKFSNHNQQTELYVNVTTCFIRRQFNGTEGTVKIQINYACNCCWVLLQTECDFTSTRHYSHKSRVHWVAAWISNQKLPGLYLVLILTTQYTHSHIINHFKFKLNIFILVPIFSNCHYITIANLSQKLNPRNLD